MTSALCTRTLSPRKVTWTLQLEAWDFPTGLDSQGAGPSSQNPHLSASPCADGGMTFCTSTLLSVERQHADPQGNARGRGAGGSQSCTWVLQMSGAIVLSLGCVSPHPVTWPCQVWALAGFGEAVSDGFRQRTGLSSGAWAGAQAGGSVPTSEPRGCPGSWTQCPSPAPP